MAPRALVRRARDCACGDLRVGDDRSPDQPAVARGGKAAVGSGAAVNILQVCDRYWPCINGAERYVQETSERLVREDHSVTDYTTDAYDVALFWRRGFRRLARKWHEHKGVQIRRFPVRHLP